MPIEHAVLTHRHVQSSASAAWTIEHGLATYPVVDVYVEANGVVQKILPLSVTYVNANTVEVAFTAARTGFAMVVA